MKGHKWLDYSVIALVIGAIAIVFISVWYAGSVPDSSSTQLEAIQAEWQAQKNRIAQRQLELKAAELDPVKQKQIWDAEHVTFEIENRFGKAMIAAIKNADRPRVASFFRQGISAGLLTGNETVRKIGSVSERKKTREESGGQTTDVGQVVSSLIQPIARFQKIEQERLRVVAIERVSGADVWQARLLMTIVGTGKDAVRLLFESEYLAEFHIGDEEKLGEQAVIEKWVTHSETFRTSSQTVFEEVTRQAGLDSLGLPDNWKVSREYIKGSRYQRAVVDFDCDGDLDIAVTAKAGRPLLLQQDSRGRFSDVATSLGILPLQTGLPPSNPAAWIDFDNDGYPDLILGRRLYRNEAGKRFTDVTQESGIQFDFSCSGCVVADYDCDGRLDIYAVYSRPKVPPRIETMSWIDDSSSGEENQLWRNEGDGRFRNVTQESGSAGGKRHTKAAAWFFYDDDHYPDLYLANDFGTNLLLRNLGNGTFEDVSALANAGDFATSMGVATGDINNDGKTDIYVANMYSKMGRRIIGNVGPEDYPEGIFRQIQGSCAGNRLYLSDASNGYHETSEQMGVNAVGWAYAPAMVDLDGDGWLDLYATTGYFSVDRGKPDG